MSGTRKMGKFELDAFVREQLEGAMTPGASPASGEIPKADVATEVPIDSKKATAKVGKMEIPEGALPTGGEFEPQPILEESEKSEWGEARLPEAPHEETPDPSLPRVSHPPARPPAASGPSQKDVQEEPSIIVAKAPPAADAAALRTRLAKKFVSLADDVNEEFSEFAIGAGAGGVGLTAPQGMSTGGGKQALQHLRMRPRRAGYSVLVGGTVNQLEKSAELRDYEHICIMHESRFRKRLEITENEWEQFLRKAEVVLREAEVQCERVGPPKELVAQRRSLTRGSRIAAAALVVILVLAAIVLFRIVTT
jgi:hypothetical protein